MILGNGLPALTSALALPSALCLGTGDRLSSTAFVEPNNCVLAIAFFVGVLEGH
jgi:hypothetical protein